MRDGRVAAPFAAVVLVVVTAVAPIVTDALASPDPPEKPLAEQGYVGVALRDLPGGLIEVARIFPGPWRAAGARAPSRGDVITSVDGHPMDASTFRDYVRGLDPGERVALSFRAADDRADPPSIRTVELVLDSRGRWVGTLGRPRAHEGRVQWTEPGLLEPDDPSNRLGAAVHEHQLAAPLDTLLEVFEERLARDEDFHSLSRVRAVF
ncbi:MAG: hypothetical protein ACYTGC_09115, partial [Planctomycetota bacterium]